MSVPETLSLAVQDLAEAILQVFYVLQGHSDYEVDEWCLVCLTDCSRFHYMR